MLYGANKHVLYNGRTFIVFVEIKIIYFTSSSLESMSYLEETACIQMIKVLFHFLQIFLYS